MIVGIVLVLILGSFVEWFKDVVGEHDRLRQLAASVDEGAPVLRREVVIKNPIRSR